MGNGGVPCLTFLIPNMRPFRKIIIEIGISLLFFGVAGTPIFAQRATLEPPLVTLWNKQVSNDEIFYIGGQAAVPEATVIIYIQSEDGSILSREVKTDGRGAWFYSHPEFLTRGRYTIWTQLKVDELLSPPSPQLNIDVIATALQLGRSRVSYEGLYLIFASGLFAVVLSLFGFVIWHFRQHRAKSGHLEKEIAEAEQAVKRGFAVLRRDIMAELETIKKSKKLTGEEKTREEKLLRDLQLVEQYIGKEVWDIERAR